MDLKQPSWSGRRTRWLLILLHVPFVAFITIETGIVGLGGPPPHGLVAVPLSLIGGGLQIRHSLAAARGERPSYWRLTYLLLLVIACVPIVFLDYRWTSMLWFVVASSAMLLPRPLAVAAIGASCVGQALYSVFLSVSPGEAVFEAVYPPAILLMGGGSLYAAARLVKISNELQAARMELAEVAVRRERLRISRDLHDLLGHSLSAVALKGDLVIRLLKRQEPMKAAAEIESLSSVARTAIRDMARIPHDVPIASFGVEARAAVALLAAAGVDSRLGVPPTDLSAPVDNLFGWAVREGVTNVLRHSGATVCSIDVRREHGSIHLEIENDGASSEGTDGYGLIGLAARAEAVSGCVSGHRTTEGRFWLHVEVPEGTS